MKRLLWIMGVIAIALSIGACSNAVDSVKAVEDPDNPDNPVDGLNLATLNSLDDIVFSRRKNISVKLGLAGATSFSIKSGGSLPSGLSMDSDGLITGTANTVPTDATASFTVVADTGTETPLTWKVKAEQTQRFLSSIHWTAPNAGYSTDNTSTLQVLAIGGGGGGGATIQGIYGGGGGGGQFREQAIQVTPGEVIAITPGSGGASAASGGSGGMGGTTTFGSYLTALGGGGGRGWNGGTPPPLEGRNAGGTTSNAASGGNDGVGDSGSGRIRGKSSSSNYAGVKIAGGAGGPGGRDVTSYNPSDLSDFNGSYINNGAPVSGASGFGAGGAGGPVGFSAGGANGSVYVNY